MTLTFLLFQWPSPSAVLLSFIDERRWLLNYAMLCNWCIHQLSKTILEQTRWIFYQTNFQLWSNSYSEQWYSFVQKSLFIQSHSLCPQKLPVWSQQCLLLLLCCRVMMLKTCDLKHKTSANVSVWMLQSKIVGMILLIQGWRCLMFYVKIFSDLELLCVPPLLYAGRISDVNSEVKCEL